MDLTDSFRKVWESWLASPYLEENIRDHLEIKQPFLVLLERSVRQLQSSLPGQEIRVLEVGCGTAAVSYHLAKHFGVQCFAMDLSPEAVELARRIGEKLQTSIDVRVGDATKMAFEEGFFHLIFSQGVMEHFNDPVPCLQEQLRVLHDKGYLIVDVPQKFNPYTVYKHMKMRKGEWPYGWETEYSFSELRQFGERLGMEVVDKAAWGAIPKIDSVYMDLMGANSKPIQQAVFSILGKTYNVFYGLLAYLLPRLQHYFMMNVSVVYRRK